MSSSRRWRGWITSGIAISSMSLSIFQQIPRIWHSTEFWDSTFAFWKEPTLITDICPKSRKGEWPCSVQLLSRVRLFATPWTTACQASLSITSSQSLPKPMSSESVMPSNHLILCHPLLLLPSIFPSISSVQTLSCVPLFATPWTTACQASLSITSSRNLPKPMSTESVMPSNHLTLCRPLLLLPSIFPSIGSFQMSQLSATDGQSIGVSASTSVLPMNSQDWSPLGWTGWISLQSKGLSRVFSNTTVQKHQFFGTQLSLLSNYHIIHDHWKNHSLD